MIISCWAQPVPESLLKWKQDGVTVFFNPDRGSLSQADTHAAIGKAGLQYVDTPLTSTDLERMVADTACLWINLGDEPSLRSPNYNDADGGAAFRAYVDAWMAKNKWIATQTNKRKPLFLNHVGPKIGALGNPYRGQNENPYSQLTGPGDILSCDWYPKNMNADRYPNDYVGQALQNMKTWWPGRRYFTFLECSDQGLDGLIGSGMGRAPTPQDIDEQLESAVSQAGILGFAWFSHQFKGLPWDRAGAAGATAWDGRSADLLSKTRDIANRLNPKVDPIAELRGRVLKLENDVQALKQATVKSVTAQY